MRIEIHSKLVEANLERLADGPGIKDLIRFEAILGEQFTQTQARTHIDTGSLKRSGRHKSSMDRKTSRWEGEISYGGPSTPNNPVDYAHYEQARGGGHDFMRPTTYKKYDQKYFRAIIDFFDGKRK